MRLFTWNTLDVPNRCIYPEAGLVHRPFCPLCDPKFTIYSSIGHKDKVYFFSMLYAR